MTGDVDLLLPHQTVVRTGNVLAERLHDETLIIDLATDRCTRLNLSGSLLWEALESPCTLEALARRLEREFDLQAGAARADAAAFVRELRSRDLVSVERG